MNALTTSMSESTTRRRLRRRLGGGALALALHLSPVQAQEVIVVLSSQLAPYTEAYAGFLDSLGRSAETVSMTASGVEIPTETRVVATFGTRAALVSYPETMALVHCMAPGASMASALRSAKTARVHLLPPPSLILETLSRLQPGLQRLGILQVLRMPTRFISDMRLAAEDRGMEIFNEHLESAEELPEHLRALMKRDIDALWLPPDPLLINPQSIAVIREFSWSNDIPFYAPTSGLAESGATASVAPSFRQIGVAAAIEVRRILAGDRIQQDVYPSQIEITVNEASAEQAGLSLAPAALKAADEIIGSLP
jgi:hypothetical protein